MNGWVKLVAREVFKTSLVLYIVFLGIDSVYVGYVSTVFNSGILLITMGLSGLLILLGD